MNQNVWRWYEEIGADAARYRFIRDNLAQVHSPKMSGHKSYRFRAPRGEGHSLDEVVDRLIAEADEHKRIAAQYGFCPHCGAPCKLRERRPDGNDTCTNGHVYPSAAAVMPTTPPAKRLTLDDVANGRAAGI